MGEFDVAEVGVGIAWENAWRSQQAKLDGVERAAWVSEWRRLASEGVSDPLSWAMAGFTPEQAEVWVRRAAELGWDEWVTLQWAASGLRIERVFVDAGVCPQERPLVERVLPRWGTLRRWLTPYTPTMVRLALLEVWGEHGISGEVADRWRRLGFFSPADAARWRSTGFSPLEAAQWELVGVSAVDAVATRVHGTWVACDPGEVNWDDVESWGDDSDDDWGGDGDGDWDEWDDRGEPTHP